MFLLCLLILLCNYKENYICGSGFYSWGFPDARTFYGITDVEPWFCKNKECKKPWLKERIHRSKYIY